MEIYCLIPSALQVLGDFLRSSSLDELPEIFKFFEGEMSWVGPRPLLMQYLERYSDEQMRRHNVLPGVTGWAQVNGRNALSWQEKFRLDVWYVDHWTFLAGYSDSVDVRREKSSRGREFPRKVTPLRRSSWVMMPLIEGISPESLSAIYLRVNDQKILSHFFDGLYQLLIRCWCIVAVSNQTLPLYKYLPHPRPEPKQARYLQWRPSYPMWSRGDYKT